MGHRARHCDLDPISRTPYGPAARNVPHQEAAHTTVPDLTATAFGTASGLPTRGASTYVGWLPCANPTLPPDQAPERFRSRYRGNAASDCAAYATDPPRSSEELGHSASAEVNCAGLVCSSSYSCWVSLSANLGETRNE